MFSVNLMDFKVVDKFIYEMLFKDEYVVGLYCWYMWFMKCVEVNEIMEIYVDEYFDGWLDLEVCEGCIGKGGCCEVVKCFWRW